VSNEPDWLAPESFAPAEPASGVRLSAPAVGFTIHAKDGTVLATEEHFENALHVQRDLDAAEEVRRVSDGAVCATKHRLQGDHVFSWAWRLRREPERE
jgi:hypothetical protein